MCNDHKKLPINSIAENQMLIPSDNITFDQRIRQILNPVELRSERKRIVPTPHPQGILYEKKEGIAMHSSGAIQTISERVDYAQTLSDGTGIGESGLIICQTCKKLVSSASIHRCPCGQTCCVSKGCGCYSRGKDQWFCSKKHSFMAKLKINLHWIS